MGVGLSPLTSGAFEDLGTTGDTGFVKGGAGTTPSEGRAGIIARVWPEAHENGFEDEMIMLRTCEELMVANVS